MTIDLTLLDPAFMSKCQELIDTCAKNDIIIVPYYGIRTLEAQAKLWRQSRTTQEVNQKIASLNDSGATYLAKVLEDVGPQPTAKWATDAIPGFSWHNWGQALDCYLVLDGKICWNGLQYPPYGRAAKEIGLTWGGDFSMPDPCHVQLNPQEIPDLYDIQYVNNWFKDKEGYGGQDGN